MKPSTLLSTPIFFRSSCPQACFSGKKIAATHSSTEYPAASYPFKHRPNMAARRSPLSSDFILMKWVGGN